MDSIAFVDHGTPASTAEALVDLEIDGLPVRVPAGTSVLRAAHETGIAIPKLCATESLQAFGSCRLCLVEIDGRKGLPASCTTPVEAGMKVRTQSDRLAARRVLGDLLRRRACGEARHRSPDQDLLVHRLGPRGLEAEGARGQDAQPSRTGRRRGSGPAQAPRSPGWRAWSRRPRPRPTASAG